MKYPFSLKEWQTDIWIFVGYFLKNKQVTKATDGICCQGKKNWIFKRKLKFWKTFICHYELVSVIIFRDFFDELKGVINECDFLILCNEICR